ncbi:uncharacterized protein BDR25DRAFT_238629 [Lindgomyces ingoldianus]|uniref:Uncharacterized protein n=1 Tax=Lindgomyces ingoldianus TaxID=673940 RepID=A0ACB6QI15_9PLEO|nr:uncharacterized protein BDR25DRAFT_238629 [Lindgomyces ingoldianus]KAF2465972.1 hypothetical protein BDR25DRAFT_238629 [Lindgomyces ingoldianus]
MVGPPSPPKLEHHCGICSKSFRVKLALKQHMLHHKEMRSAWTCKVCNTRFEDELALEQHRIKTLHDLRPDSQCHTCKQYFPSANKLNRHRKFPLPCADAFRKPSEPKNRNGPAQMPRLANSPGKEYAHPTPKFSLSYIEPSPDITRLTYIEPSPGQTSTTSAEGPYCDVCKKYFANRGAYNNHWLGCRPSLPVQALPARSSQVHAQASAATLSRQGGPVVSPPQRQKDVSKSAVIAQRQDRPPKSLMEASKPIPITRSVFPPQLAQPAFPPPIAQTSTTNIPSAPAPISFQCKIRGCQATFQSKPALNVHKADIHGVGGRNPDLHRKDPYMLSHIQKQSPIESEVYRPHQSPGITTPRNLRGGEYPASGHPSDGYPSPQQLAAPASYYPPMGPSGLPGATSSSVSGPEDMIQAREIREKIMRLLLQSDVVIHHDGKITCGGINWTRVGVSRQREVAGMFAKLCHLPETLQYSEYLPPPKTFKDEYTADYPVGRFKLSPERFITKPTLEVVAISCSRITLANGLQEVVKIAAIDVTSCRILMNHLVCTDPKASVRDWLTNTTGLTAWRDMEAARQLGYKVLKGWWAARAALWKFIDKQTILVGYNLRGELDALRMIHGRSVDVAKIVEKAASGPLSKQQLSLESLCRDLPAAHLTTNPTFGQDALQNAFAIRELCLYIIKNEDNTKRWAKAKSLDYQRATGTA